MLRRTFLCVAAASAWAAGGTAAAQCGCSDPPIDPLVAGADHSCEDHSLHNHSGQVLDGIDLSCAILAGANLVGTSLVDADLADATLAFGSLAGADFSGADLTNADLSSAFTVGVDLTGADARGADFNLCNLSTAGLAFTDLRNAVLGSVNLTGADLRTTRLTGVDLSGATLVGANLTGVDLSGASLFLTNIDQAFLLGADLGATNPGFAAGTPYYDACTDFGATGFDPVAAGWIDLTAFPLVACGGNVSVTQGGELSLHLDAGAGNAGKVYVVLGSISGTKPGTPLPGGSVIPLNFDAYFNLTLAQPNMPPLVDSFGALDLQGRGLAKFFMPSGSDIVLVGTTVWHAFAVIELPSLTASFVSNAEARVLVP